MSATTSTVDRALDLLMLFASSELKTLGVTEIARTMSVSKSTAHRTLSSLRTKGFVEFDEPSRRYRLGPQVLQLGLAYLDDIDLRSIARPSMVKLSSLSAETCTLSIRHGFTRVYVDQVTPERDVRMVVELGRAWPLHAGASSKAFLAFLSDDEVDLFLAQKLEKLTEVTVVNAPALRTEIAAIRDCGFATSLGERQAGAASVAAPIFDSDSRPRAVISISGPSERFQQELDVASKQLLKETKAISQRLGAR